MTLIVDCLVNKGILIGADCKITDVKYHNTSKAQKIFPFYNKAKELFIFCLSGVFTIQPNEACKKLSTDIKYCNISSCLEQLAVENLNTFKDRNITIADTDGCSLFLFYYRDGIPYQSEVIFIYNSEKKRIGEANQLKCGFINSNLLGEKKQNFKELIYQKSPFYPFLYNSRQTKQPISYEDGQNIVQWVIEKYTLRYPDICTGSGIQMGILKPTGYEWIRKDFDQ